MRKHLAKRVLWRRIVALTAAYAIALSSLMATYGAARAAAEAAGASVGILCHTNVAGTKAASPAGDQTNGNICVDDCCIGCMMLIAALPLPPADAAPLLRSSGQRVAPLAIAGLLGRPEPKSHRSRAPPLPA